MGETTRPAIDAGTWEKIASGELRVCHADGCSNVFAPTRTQQRYCELQTCTKGRKPCAWCGDPRPLGKRGSFCDGDACAAERREASKQLSVTGLPRYAVRLALRSFRDADARGRATGGALKAQLQEFEEAIRDGDREDVFATATSAAGILLAIAVKAKRPRGQRPRQSNGAPPPAVARAALAAAGAER